MIYSKNFFFFFSDSLTDSWLRETYRLVCEPGHCWKIVSHKYICLAFIQVCVGSPNKLNPQNHLFFGQFSLSIDIYIQTYFNIYLVLVLASKSISPIHFNPCRFLCWHAITFSKINFNAYTPCYLPNLFQFLIGSFAGCPA